ncbi:MAG: HDOD domain-containing protein, partial [Opitutaceae bacterium]
GGMLRDMDSAIDEITDLLKRDTALTARIIRISNSVAYNTGSLHASLEEAVARVGFAEVYRLTGFAAVAQMSERTLVLYGIKAAHLRENSLLTALLIEAIAQQAGLDPREAYTAGLLRSTGKIALDRLAREIASPGGYEGDGRGPLAEWETNLVGLSNCEAAARILQEWRFPKTTVESIRHHYAPLDDSPALATLLNLAAGAAERCGHGLPGERFYWEVTPEKLAAVGLEQGQLDDASRLALERFGPMRAALA